VKQSTERRLQKAEGKAQTEQGLTVAYSSDGETALILWRGSLLARVSRRLWEAI
jgi:hypothetical protein